MSVTVITDHSDAAVARLASQFKEQPRIEGLIRAFTDQYQGIEDILDDMRNGRDVYSAIGAQLDIIGAIVGEAREGRSDDEYRIAIQGKIAINTSNSTEQSITAIFNIATNSSETQLLEFYPAAIMLYADHDISALDTDAIYALMQRVLAAGVKLFPLAYVSSPDEAFRFDTGPGYSSTAAPTVGGKYASLA